MKTKNTCLVLLSVMICISILAGCASPKGSTGMGKRVYTQDMRSEALLQLYQLEPASRSEIAAAPGYAVFEAVQTQILITSTGNAYGIVRDNKSGTDTYLSAFSAGAGFGVGIKGFRAIVVFKDRAVMDEFIENGWVFGASATADATPRGEGASSGGMVTFDKRLKVYTFTDKGLMAGASLRGVKVWKDKKLN